ncbi:hypothetical protein ABK040_005959 [Willaertia magna]
MLYVLLSAFASLLAGVKVIETRRRLQQQRTSQVSLTEAIIHSAFDVVDKFSFEFNKIGSIIEQRINQQPPMLTFVNPNNNQPINNRGNNSILYLPSPSMVSNNLPLNFVQNSNVLNNNLNNQSMSMYKKNVVNSNNQSNPMVVDPMLFSIPDNSQRITRSSSSNNGTTK